jgi:hypothetical protein
MQCRLDKTCRQPRVSRGVACGVQIVGVSIAFAFRIATGPQPWPLTCVVERVAIDSLWWKSPPSYSPS